MQNSGKWRWGMAAGVVLALGVASLWLRASAEANRLVRSDPAEVFADQNLLRYAHERAARAYAGHCATCHGVARTGDMRRGVPSLVDQAWIYAADPVDLEHTIAYGIRSGHPKARNVAEMPGMVLTGQLTVAETDDVVEYLLAISSQSHEAAAAERGRSIFLGKGNCFDCHANDAKGVIDYGAPALLGPEWIYGGDRATLRASVFGGRHGKCPAWIGILSPADIRALAIDLTPAESRPVGERYVEQP